MKEYIDYLMKRLKTDIAYFTIFSDGAIRIEMKTISQATVKLALITEIIKDIVTIKIDTYEADIEDFDSKTPSILFEVIK